MWISTIIVAAGSGKRFGSKKQFYPLCGKPVVMRSIEAFRKLSREMIVVLPGSDIKNFRRKWLAGLPDIKVVSGGARRSDSVLNGLKELSAKCDYVCVHDGARPLIDRKTIKRCFAAAKRYGSAVCSVRATDTVKIADKRQFVKATPDRPRVWMVQTPQVFRKKTILAAYGKLRNTAGVTDDSSLVEKLGIRPKLVQGEYSNIKITKKEDLLFAEQIIRK